MTPSDSRASFLHNLILFARLLRNLGMPVSATQVHDLAHALRYIELGNRLQVKDAMRCVLVTRREDLGLYEQAFDWFWRRREYDDESRRAAAVLAPQFPRQPPAGTRFAPTGLTGFDSELLSRGQVVSVQTYSEAELLRRKDFGAFSPQEVEALKKLMRDLSWNTGERATRRKERGGADYIDFRSSSRKSLQYGGELMELAWKRTRMRPRPLVVLCDISGSMENYSRMLLHFIHALREREAQAEVFVFSTRLTRITRQLRTRQVERALRDVASRVVDWSGGTRIGAALKTFNYVWARRVLRPGAVVLIISDGWDRGDPDLLEREMARLRRNVFRIIWLNPLLATPEYEPLTVGLRAALPYVDDFLPAHNLLSLEDLARRLGDLRKSR